MNCFLRSTLFIWTLSIFCGCAGGKIQAWRQFHGDLPNQGFQEINSGFALSSNWISDSYKVTSASPVIGRDFQGREVLYIGTIDGALVAIRSEDGSEKWHTALDSSASHPSVVSSAAVSDTGDIYVIGSRKIGAGRAVSTLHKVDQFGYIKWSYRFADGGFTSGSPKVTRVGKDTLIFVYVTVEVNGTFQGELFVLRDDGYGAKTLDRKPLGTCRFDPHDTARNLRDRFDHAWDLVSGFHGVQGDAHAGLPDYFVDPTVAVDVSGENPMIAIADNLCSIGAFVWQGTELSVLWRHEHGFDQHSSPMISTNGLMVFGKSDGKVPAYDLKTGVKMWEYDAGQPVYATPAASGVTYIFVVSKDHIQVINALDGTVLQDDKLPRMLSLQGVTYSSPAATANRVYISTFEMVTLTHDLKTRGHDTHFHGNGLSSVVLGSDGSVYGIAADGTVRKYAGTGTSSHKR